LRRIALPFYALIFLTEVIWVAIVPLAPTFAHRFALSKVETGAVLASAAVATLLVSLPIGVLTDRLGARRLIVGSAALASLSALAQGLAYDFWSLLVARAAFGVALGAIWTAGLAWISDARARRGPAGLGVPITVAGFGIMVGPAFAGIMADRFGVRAPFIVLAVAIGATTFALRGERVDTRYGHEPLAHTLRQAVRDPVLLGGLVVMALVGVTGGGVNLLVPLELRSHGISAAAIGLAFSGSSAIFVLVSVLVTRMGARVVRLRFVGAAALLYGGSMLLGVASASTAVLVLFVLVRAPFWAALSTLAYPLGALGSHRARLGVGAIMGLVNLVWGASGAIGPVAAGAVAQLAGERWAFAGLTAACLGSAVWLLAPGRDWPASDDLQAASADTS
jgi:MFS family permease